MSTITKEWLQQKIAGMEATRDEIPFGLGEDGTNTLAALRIALASLEAEPVAYIREARRADGFCFADGIHPTHRHQRLPLSTLQDGCYWVVTPLYAAPPAPVSVPAAMEMDDEFDSAFEHGKAVGWNAYRAAMLQGAEPVTTANKLPFDQWLSQQTGTIDVECGCVMTEVFFHWLRVAYEAGNYPVIPDEVLSAIRKVASIRADFDDFDGDRRGIGDCLDEAEQELIVTINKHASVIAAAPQQEAENRIQIGKSEAKEEWDIGARLTKHRFKP